MTSELAKRLEHLINSKIKEYPLPVVKGNSIRIKNYVVRFSKKAGWLVYDCENSVQVGRFFAKSAALAYAKVLSSSDNNNWSLQNIKKLDDQLSKHYQDCVFYNHSMKNTKDMTRYDVLATRFDISYDIAYDVKSQLDDIILY